MPVYMWLGVFAIAYSTILTITLDENNIQLISMRILSGIWDWISFDELKRINLRMPDGRLNGDGLYIAVLQNVSVEREDLRYAMTYEKGQRLEIKGSVPEIGLEGGVAEVRRTFANGKVEIVKNGRSIKFNPQKIDPMIDKDRMSLATIETIQIHEGDRIRWTDNDKDRGIYNASLATITGIHNGNVTVELANKDQVTLKPNDKMMQRMDLAYALNMHMAQGITVNKAITVMQSFERNLSNQRLFNVGVTRIRLDLTMVVDNQQKLEMQLDRNPGDKTSSLESLGWLDIDGAAVQAKAANDALTKAMESLDEAGSAKILIDPTSLDMTDLPPMEASTTDYSDVNNLGGEMPSIKDGVDADHSNVGADRKDDDLGMRPLEMDDLSALPSMLGSGNRTRGLPEKNLSLDM